MIWTKEEEWIGDETNKLTDATRWSIPQGMCPAY